MQKIWAANKNKLPEAHFLSDEEVEAGALKEDTGSYISLDADVYNKLTNMHVDIHAYVNQVLRGNLSPR